MDDGIRDAIETTGKVLKAAPELYEDGLKPAVSESGKTIALIPQAINAALVPFRIWIAKQENKYDEVVKLLNKKLEKIDVDNIVTPEEYVVVPALQSLQYSMNSGELKDLYANLIAKSMNVDTKDKVHPTFVEIIKQMSPIDAVVFKIICQTPYKPLINLKALKEDGNFGDYINNISWINIYSYEQVAISIDNLLRLGLIEIFYDKHYYDDGVYELVRKAHHYIEQRALLDNKGKVVEEKKTITIPKLAWLFYRICVKE